MTKLLADFSQAWLKAKFQGKPGSKHHGFPTQFSLDQLIDFQVCWYWLTIPVNHCYFGDWNPIWFFSYEKNCRHEVSPNSKQPAPQLLNIDFVDALSPLLLPAVRFDFVGRTCFTTHPTIELQTLAATKSKTPPSGNQNFCGSWKSTIYPLVI